MTPEDREFAQQREAEEKKKKRGRLYYRRARRMARRLGLHAENDEQAAQMLEERGIDIMKDNVSLLDGGDEGDRPLQAAGGKTPAGTQVVSNLTLNDAERLAEVHAIQMDLVRRRRRRLFWLLLRLLFFVGLPTFIVGHFYYTKATDLYQTKAEFIIQKADNARGTLGLGSLLSGTGFANSADSIVVQGYLTSREALMRLDEEEGYRAHFEQPFIDDLHRLEPDASFEDAYKLYQKYTKVGYDPAEGVIRMEVVAADPETSQRFAEALIRFAEERVDHLSQRVREDQMKGSLEVYREAEKAMTEASNRVLELQKTRGILSPDAEITSQLGIVNALEQELELKRQALSIMLDNEAPNKVRVDALNRDIERIQTRIQELRNGLTGSNGPDSEESLAEISAELKVAEVNLQTRQAMLQEAMQQLEAARIEANRQVRYLSKGVVPIAPDVPTYPRKLENTILAFIIFMGIYILFSLTISILREQVSV